MNDQTKTLVDVGMGTITATAVMEVIPPLTAILSLIWIAIRIWETDTVQKLCGSLRKTSGGSDD